MKAYSDDLRDRAISFYNSKQYKMIEIAKLLYITRHTLANWIRRYKKNGEYASRQHIQTGRIPRFSDRDKILKYLEKNPNANVRDIQRDLAPDIPMSTLYDTLKRMNITFKKKSPFTRNGKNENDLHSAHTLKPFAYLI